MVQQSLPHGVVGKTYHVIINVVNVLVLSIGLGIFSRLNKLMVWCAAESFFLPTVLSYLFAEDVDPSVGRFRNMVQTAVVPVKVGNTY